MSQSLDTLVLNGTLTTQPKRTDSGAVVFTLAHTRFRKLYGWGWTEWERKTSYLQCVVFPESSKNAALAQARRGTGAVVRGRIETFPSKESTCHDNCQIVVDELVFIGRSAPRPTPV